jgi:hypothetical protein
LVWYSSSYNTELSANISYSFSKNYGSTLHKLSIMNKSIETLNFFIGGFSGGYERIIWLNDKLHHQYFTGGGVEDEEARPDDVLNVATPSTKDWEEFWQKVDTLKVWSWEKEYINSDIIDGTEWELRIKREGRRRRRIYGLNAYPQPERIFNSFVKAINKLSRSKI